jgi:hypothetical protein
MHGTFNNRITCNLRAEDYQQLAAAAKKAGVPLAPFLRDAAMAYLGKRFLVPPRLDELLARLIGETRRVGNNVNQVAAKVNASATTSREDLDRVKAEIAMLEDVTRILRTVLHNLTVK